MEPLHLNTGTVFPRIGFGTWNLREGSEVIASVKTALETGYRLIDTAKIYRNEAGVGEAIHGSGVPRQEVIVTTKLWGNDQGYDSAFRAYDESLERLNLEYIDLYLIHWPAHESRLRRDSWAALEELYKSHRVRAIGVSNYTVELLREMEDYAEIMPAVNQVEFHPYIFQEHQEIVEYCTDRGIIFEAYSPLAKGRWFDDTVIERIASDHGKTSAQVMLRWCIQHGTVPIPKSAHPQRIRENFEVFDFSLNPQDMEALDKLG